MEMDYYEINLLGCKLIKIKITRKVIYGLLFSGENSLKTLEHHLL
jgi:hypothetical protein